MPVTTTDGKPSVRRRMVWFVALWLGGVAAVGAAAYGLRAVIKAVS